jgi:hypothetical protein
MVRMARFGMGPKRHGPNPTGRGTARPLGDGPAEQLLNRSDGRVGARRTKVGSEFLFSFLNE